MKAIPNQPASRQERAARRNSGAKPARRWGSAWVNQLGSARYGQKALRKACLSEISVLVSHEFSRVSALVRVNSADAVCVQTTAGGAGMVQDQQRRQQTINRR